MHSPSGAVLPSLVLVLLSAACASPSAPLADPAASQPGAPPTLAAPGTPAPAPPDPGAPAVGGAGSNRFEVGAGAGLYLVDPARGEAAVQGFVVVTLGPVGAGNFIPPDDTVVTLNGVALLRDPTLNGAYWRVDAAGPQPVVGSGGRMVIVATGTVGAGVVSRTLVLPCPADVAVASTPAPGAALAPGDTLRLSAAADLTLNVGIPAMASIFPEATLHGYDPVTRALSPSGSPHLVPPGPLDLALTVTDAAAPAYLLDLRWPGTWVIDGETGGFCGLAKRLVFAR
jgi:hypothetical protein